MHDVLAGDVRPEWFSAEERDEVHASASRDLKASGLAGKYVSRAAAWAHFTSNVHAHLNLVLCVSPAHGAALRVKCRNYPKLLSCCSLDMLRPWPNAALHSVARKVTVTNMCKWVNRVVVRI